MVAPPALIPPACWAVCPDASNCLSISNICAPILVAIAFAVVSPIHRREKTLKAVFASYQEKNKVRTAAYEKIARASQVKTQAENPKQEAAQVQPENEQVQE
jgi:membrane protein required for beta-lactamase induction